MNKIALILIFPCLAIGQLQNISHNFGLNRIGFNSAKPTYGTWYVGDMINDNSSGDVKIWYCKSQGTFSSYSDSGATVSGSPNIVSPNSVTGVLLGHLVTLSAGFSAGDKRVIAKSNRSGVTSSSCTCSNASYSINAVSNITSYALGDYVQISAGWPSATAAYRITIIDTANLRLTVDAISTSAQTGITLTQVKGITVNSNATGTNAKIYVTTTDPTFGYFGTITDGKYQSGDTLRAGSATAYAQLDSVNGILLGGTTKVWDDIRINPGSFDRPGTSDPSLVAAGSTYLWEFQKNDSATVTVQFPHSYSAGDTVYIHLHWTPATRGNEEGTATVGWKAGYTWASIDSVFPAWTVADLSDTCENTDWDHLYTQDIAIPGPGKFESSMMLINVKRTDTGADDTWASAVSGQLPFLLELDIHYPINKLGTDDH